MCPSFSQKEYNIDENHKIVWSDYELFFLLLLYFKKVKRHLQNKNIILFSLTSVHLAMVKNFDSIPWI